MLLIGINLVKKICGIIISGINWIIWNFELVKVEIKIFKVKVINVNNKLVRKIS